MFNLSLYRWQALISAVGAALLSTVTLRPVSAAERITVSYGPFERSIPVKSLTTYAQTGNIDQELAAYTRKLPPEQVNQLQQILTTRIPFNVVEVSQFLYTPTGINLLTRLQKVIQAGTQSASFSALRAAFILAAADPQGLTLLNVLEKYPVAEIEIDLPRALDIAQNAEALVQQTNQAVALIQQQSKQTSTSRRVTPVDLTQAGQFQSNQLTFAIQDRDRNRTFPVDLYIPRTTTPRPVIVISHGLGSDRLTFAYLAQHLATYGFIVAVPEHPGSNDDQLQALLAGVADQVTPPSEFIDRPLDVTVLLNQLEQLSQTDSRLQGRLNLQQVGVIGQSFGGYTALALAGSPINFRQLRLDCPKVDNLFNLSLLLQCRALALPRGQYNLSDRRIKAAIAINPVSSRILGQAGLSQINIPIMMIAGSADVVTPALTEQIRPFAWLTTPNKYLALIQGGTHFSVLGNSEGSSTIPVPAQAVGASPELAHQYVEALSTAFFQVHLSNQSSYDAYLSNDYINRLSREPLPLYLVRSPTQAISRPLK